MNENQQLRDALAEAQGRLEQQEQQLNLQGEKIAKLEELLLRQSVAPMNGDMSTIQEISYVSQANELQVSGNDYATLKSLFRERNELQEAPEIQAHEEEPSVQDSRPVLQERHLAQDRAPYKPAQIEDARKKREAIAAVLL